MTAFFRDNDIKMGRCGVCDHDLLIRDNRKTRRAKAYCSNPGCRYAKRKHPTTAFLNKGKAGK